MKLHDISPLISERLGVFPGDQAFSRQVAMSFSQGHHLELGAIAGTVHLGAHADAPIHYTADGVPMHERDLSYYFGRCLVLRADVARNDLIGVASLPDEWRDPKRLGAERVLVATGTFPDPERWNGDFAAFEPALIELWAKNGVRLIGIDTPSIDPETSKTLDAHHMVARYDMAILEGLMLSDISPGYYTLIALPLKIEGADASPVRAVLVEPALN